MKTQKKIVLEYIDYFNLHDVKSISKLLDDAIELQDWDIQSNGKTKVLNSFQNIFDSLKTIKINIIKIYELDYTIIAHLEIFLNKNDKISVIDIIEFSSTNKIKKIRAFKG